jgi:hypothetical protein
LSDTVTLLAGVLLTSVGLLALLPYVLKRGWRDAGVSPTAGGADSPVLATAEASPDEPQGCDSPLTVAAGEIQELLAHLFSLRMTVSELTAEVQAAHEALDGVPGAEEAMPVEDVA